MRIVERKEHRDYIVEKLVYEHEDHALTAWLMKPPGPGPFPLVVWNHNSRVRLVDGQILDETQDPTVTLEAPPYPGLREHGWMWFFPEGRGYAGSAGPRLLPLSEPFAANLLAHMYGRAADALAGIDQLLACRGDVRRDQLAVCGASHGGMVSLFVAAQRGDDVRTIIVQAPGVFHKTEAGLAEVVEALRRINAPVLFQHFRKDGIVPLSLSQKAVAQFADRRPKVTLKVYEDIEGVEGHFQFEPGNYEIMIGDFMQALEAALPTR